MREILFRGKRLDNGEWVEGSLWLYGEDACIDGALDFSEDFWIKVDPATVGQYTGLTANGKRIFEGDILNGWSLTGASDFRGKAIYWNDSFGGWYVGKFTSMGAAYHMQLEIIGNIHDNPELLKAERKAERKEERKEEKKKGRKNMIDREKLIELVSEVQYLGGLELALADHLIANGVTFATEKNVGHWLNPNNRPRTYIRKCSVCGGEAYFCGAGCSYDFCPICGVPMERMAGR